VSRRVLIVDDDPLTVNAVRRILQSAGHVTSELSSGFGFAVALRSFDPDVVLLDVHMPGLGGAGALKSAREMDISGPRILLHSGLGDVELRSLSDELSADGFVCKPASSQDLLAAVDAAA
jgi:DNA-binding response OmpR family regulator